MPLEPKDGNFLQVNPLGCVDLSGSLWLCGRRKRHAVIWFQVADGGTPVKRYSCNCPSTCSDAPDLELPPIENWEPMHPETSCNIDEYRHIDSYRMIKWFTLIQHIVSIASYSFTAILQLTVVFFVGKPYDPHRSSTPPFVWSMKGQLQLSFTPHFRVVEVVRARWRSFLKVPVATLCIFGAIWYCKSMNSRFENFFILSMFKLFTSTHQPKAAESRRGNIDPACNAECRALVWHHFPQTRNMWTGGMDMQTSLVTFGTSFKNEWRLEAQNIATPMIYQWFSKNVQNRFKNLRNRLQYRSDWQVLSVMTSKSFQSSTHPIFYGSNQAAYWRCGYVGPVAPGSALECSPRTLGSLLGSDFCSLMVFARFVSSRSPPPESWFHDIGHGNAEDSPCDS